MVINYYTNFNGASEEFALYKLIYTSNKLEIDNFVSLFENNI